MIGNASGSGEDRVVGSTDILVIGFFGEGTWIVIGRPVEGEPSFTGRSVKRAPELILILDEIT